MDIEKLKALALAATPGPWQWWTSNSTLRLTGADGRDGGVLYGTGHRGYGDVCCDVPDREFIAAAHPAAVLELIAEVERLSQDAERYRKIKADNKRSADSTFCLFLDSGGNLLPVASMDMDNEIDVAIEEGRDNT